jgi:hypothetical protein
VFAVESELLLNLLELGLDPWVLLIAMSVQLGKIAKTFLSTALADEPPW